jgi:hypothetical protein
MILTATLKMPLKQKLQQKTLLTTPKAQQPLATKGL